MRRRVTLGSIVVVSVWALLFASTAFAKTDNSAKPYLNVSVREFLPLLPPPPKLGSAQDKMELESVVRAAATADAARWKAAEADDAALYERFESAFGNLERSSVPHLRALLDRVREDLSGPISAAKAHFGRPRPFQRYQFARACGEDQPRVPEKNPTKGSSYPSSHAAQGWAVALILASVFPQRSDAVFARAHAYGESRIICGYHYPSDIDAARLLATAVVSRLHAVPDFRRDLACAQAEHRAVRGERGLPERICLP